MGPFCENCREEGHFDFECPLLPGTTRNKLRSWTETSDALTEMRSEVARHHRDFEQVSRFAEMAELALATRDHKTLRRAIRKIRNLVG